MLTLLLLAAGMLLSVITTDDPTAQSAETMQRRYLANEGGEVGGERVMDVGLEENVWRRQLRNRKKGTNNNVQQKQRRQLDADMWDEDGHERPMRRMAAIPRYTDKHHFEECTGKTVTECQTLVDDWVQAHPQDFNNQTTLYLDIRKIREQMDESYFKVVIRTNLAGDKAEGIFGDGQIYYPWPWKGQDIGPWDCEQSGTFLNPNECCANIQEDINYPDDNNLFMACFIEQPVGGPENPEREDRAIVVTDRNGQILRAPVAH